MPPKVMPSTSRAGQAALIVSLSGIALLAALFFALQPKAFARANANSDGSPGILSEPVFLWRENPFLAPMYSGCGGVIPPASPRPDFEQQIIELVNGERANRGLPPLKQSQNLNDAARYQAFDMNQDDYFSHDTFDYDAVSGELNRVCAWSQRLSGYYQNWYFLAENAAAGYATPDSVMSGWMSSSGHRSNILSDAAWETGVGYSSGGSWGHYWVQDFGKRAGVYPLIINRESGATASRQVQIYSYGAFAQMRLKNDDESFGDWQPFQNAISWTIACGVGSHKVTAELKTSGGTVYTSSDSIELTVSGCPALGGLPDEVAFLYSKPQLELVPLSLSLTPKNTVTADPIHWSLTKDGSWFTITPVSGITPESFQITPVNPHLLSPGVYQGSVTVTATAPSTTEGTPKVIIVKLLVLDRALQKIYLTATLR